MRLNKSLIKNFNKGNYLNNRPLLSYSKAYNLRSFSSVSKQKYQFNNDGIAKTVSLFKNTNLNRIFGNLNNNNGGNNNNNNSNNKNNNNNNNNGPPKPPITAIVLFIVSMLYPFYANSRSSSNNGDENQQMSGGSSDSITFQDFIVNYLTNDLQKSNIDKLTVADKSIVTVYFKTTSNTIQFTIGSVKQFEELMNRYSPEIPVFYLINQPSNFQLLGAFISPMITLGILFYFMRGQLGGGSSPFNKLSGMTKNKAQVHYPKNYIPPASAPPNTTSANAITVKFEDVAGCQESKTEIMEFVDFLKNPHLYNNLGAKIPKGCILHGPPGTGKTLLAKACSNEAGVPFISISGSEFVEMFVGVGASRIRDLFKLARTLSPCIIFIDEIDAIGKKRNNNKISNGNDERENTLNQLLIEMDGFNTSTPGKEVILMASTNRLEILDDALLRPGRFDRKIEIDLPDLEGRKQIYKIHLKKLKLSAKEDMDLLAGKLSSVTAGFSGADIANVCNEAALIAVRFDSQQVDFDHFEEAISRTIAGLEKKSKVLPPDQKKIVAFHEAGHAICGWFLENCDPLLKVTIVPRGSAALGYAQYIPSDNNLMTKEQYIDTMVMALGGRCSEEIFFDTVTSGAQNDFQKVTSIASKMCKELGMSNKLGHINFSTTDSQGGGGISITKPFSESTAQILDTEIKKIVTDCHDQCVKLLTENKEAVEKVANRLLEKETITRKDMLELLGKRPYPEKHNEFEKYLDK